MESLPTITTKALNQMLEPLSQLLSVEAAQAIVSLQIGATMLARIQELADRCSEGILTEQEKAECQGYAEGAEILSLIKLKASRILREHGSG